MERLKLKYNDTRKALQCFVFFFFPVFLSNAQPSITRGPYLQLPTAYGITIRWLTDTAVSSRVDYGAGFPFTNTVIDTTLAIDHEIKISGLSSFTKYFYAVGTVTQWLSGPDTAQYFITSPVPGTVQPVRIWAIGDFGNGSDKQKKVLNSFVSYTGKVHPDVWLWLGDNAYDNGTDSMYSANVFPPYMEIMKNLPFMPSPGNHDYLSVCPPACTTLAYYHTGPYYDIINVPVNGEAGGVPSGLEAYYSFDYGNVHFMSLNSEIGSFLADSADWTGTIADSNFKKSPLYSWLISDLDSNHRKWTIAFFHQTPYAKGSHNSDNVWEVYMKAMRENILPVLEQYGVDLVLCGHDHVYERSYLLKGHYGYSSSFNDTMKTDAGSGIDSLGEAYMKFTYGNNKNTGTVYVTCGNSGKTTDSASLNGLNHPAYYFKHGCDSCAGSFIVDIDSNRLDGRYLTAWGAVLDRFTIIKQDTASGMVENLYADLKFYPNPCNGSASVFLPSEVTRHRPAEIRIIDVFGRELYKKEAPGDAVKIDCDELRQGIYFMKFYTENKPGAFGKLMVY